MFDQTVSILSTYEFKPIEFSDKLFMTYYAPYGKI